MATQYGYRLFSVDLHLRHTRKKLDFETAALGPKDSPVGFIESVGRICQAIEGVTTTEVLRYREKATEDATESAANGADVEDTSPFLRLESFSTVGRRIDFEFRFGRRGSHDLAIAEQSNGDAVLEGKAPANTFRASLYIPEKGEAAILVAETRNRLCPGEDLLRLIGVSSKAQDLERPEGSEIGWWRFSAQKISDPGRWKTYIEQGHAKGVGLLKYYVKPDGTRGDKSVTLRQDGLTASAAERAKLTALNWIGQRSKKELRDGGIDTSQTVMKQMAAFIEVKVTPGEFDDAGIAWEGPDGSTTFVTPEHLRDMFTYPLGARGILPSHAEIRHAAEVTLSDLLPILGVELDF